MHLALDSFQYWVQWTHLVDTKTALRFDTQYLEVSKDVKHVMLNCCKVGVDYIK